MVGFALPAAAADSFDDVPGSHTFVSDIEWLASEGITKGCNPPENSRFCPDDFVTRGQMAAFLVRALDLPAGDKSFTDTAGSVFVSDISRLGSAGITKGCNPPENSRFCPDDFVTRGQMAAFLHRALPATEQPVPVEPLVITTTALADGTVLAPYEQTLVAEGGVGPYVWSASGLPTGLSIGASTDKIDGAPEVDGTFSVKLTVTDSQTKTATVTLPLQVGIPAGCEDNVTISASECAALVSVYNSTNGADWDDNTAWLSGDPCDWNGVTCESGTVIELDLWDNNLIGPIPAQLGHLSNLTMLDFSSNLLTGPIPAELGKLVKLEDLWLYYNELTGEIPHELGNLVSVRDFDLDGNNLTGEIPTSLGNLSSVKYLWLNDNQLVGSIPSELGNLSNLTNLYLDGNQLTGVFPDSIAVLNPATLRVRDNGCLTASPATAAWLDGKDATWNNGCL